MPDATLALGGTAIIPYEITGAICSPEEFRANLKIDFSELVRKKGSIDYLPWAEIVRTLHQQVPHCTYGFVEATDGSVVHYTPTGNAYLRPYMTRYIPAAASPDKQAFIVKSPPGFFPISNMAARHKAIENPDIRAIDNCLRRAVAKEIGIHTGIGLQLWAASDPFDEIDDDAVTFGGAASRGPSTAPVAAPKREERANPVMSVLETLNKAADSAGLSEHGKATFAKVLNISSWDKINPDQAAKVMPILSDPDKVKLYNAGKNSKGATVNPKDEKQEIAELAAAFRK